MIHDLIIILAHNYEYYEIKKKPLLNKIIEYIYIYTVK